jgi:hypothetical protein
MAKTYHVYIDRQTGTWGIEGDLVTAEIPEELVNQMEEMSDSQLIQLAYKWEDTKNTPKSRFTEEERQALKAQSAALTKALLKKRPK